MSTNASSPSLPLRLLAVGLLFLLSFAAFGLTLEHDFVNYDDPSAILDNPVIEGPGDGRWRQLLSERREDVYLPVWFASYWVDTALGGREPDAGTFHLLNLLLHGFCACLIASLGRRIGLGFWAAGAAGAVFAVHPAALESVAWATERKGLLALALSLGALILAREYQQRGRVRWVIGAGVLALLALFAKATVFVLPLWAALAFSLAGREGESGDVEAGPRRRAGIATLALALIAGTAVAIHLAIAMDAGTANLEAGQGLGERAVGMLGVLGRYGLRMIVPLDLAVHYPTPFGGGFGLDQGHGLAVLAIVVVAGLSFLRRPGPIAFGILWAVAALIPFNNLFPRFDIPMADRYLYGALPGAAFALAGLLVWLEARAGKIAAGLGLLVLVVLGVLGARHEAPAWRDAESLWRDAIERAPDEMLPRLQLGVALEQAATTAAPLAARDLLTDALAHYDEARDRARDPREKAQALVKRAPALVRLGRPEEALVAFEAVEAAREKGEVDIAPRDRDALRISHAAALIASNRRDDARALLEEVGATTGLRIEAKNQLAVLATLDANEALTAARTEEERQAAAEGYEAALALYRSLAETWPRHEKSRCEYLRALTPAVWRKDHGIELARESRRLVDDFPESAEAHLLRARIYLDVDPVLAEADLKIAARLDPARIDASLLLAEIVRSQGRNKEAIAVLKIARRSNPDAPALKQAMAEHYLAFAYHHRNTQALDLALAATAEALELDASLREAKILRGEIYADRAASSLGTVENRARDFVRAKELFEGILAEDAREERSREGLSLLYRREGLARVYAAEREGETAAQTKARVEAGFDAFLKAVRLMPEAEENAGPIKMMRTHAQTCSRGARAALEAGQKDEALRLARRAVLFDGRSADHRSRLATTRLEGGDVQGAMIAWGEALERDGDHLESLYRLGTLRITRKEWAAARPLLERFVRVASDSEFAVVLEKQIDSARRLAADAAVQEAAGPKGDDG